MFREQQLLLVTASNAYLFEGNYVATLYTDCEVFAPAGIHVNVRY